MRFSNHARYEAIRDLMRSYLDESADQIKEYKKDDMLTRVSAHVVTEQLWLAREVKASCSPNRNTTDPKRLAACLTRAEKLNRERQKMIAEGRFIRVPAVFFEDYEFLLSEADRFAEDPPPVPAETPPALTGAT